MSSPGSLARTGRALAGGTAVDFHLDAGGHGDVIGVAPRRPCQGMYFRAPDGEVFRRQAGGMPAVTQAGRASKARRERSRPPIRGR